jgi:DNA (cytosine-5)-methyltransferase 1
MTITAFTALHIACGAGGITLGFERAGIRTAYAFDIQPVAVETHRANFPDAPCQVRDIRETHASNLPFADVWTCGIPCEPYSVAGKKLQEDDSRDIAFDVSRLIVEARIVGNQPRYVFLENVPPFAKSNGAEAIRQALANYAMLEAIFLSADYGVAQKRHRWHIIASAQSPAPSPQPTHSEFPTLFGQQPWVTFGSIRDGTGAEGITGKALRYIFNRIHNNAITYGNSFKPFVVTDDTLLPTIVASLWKGQWRSHIVIVDDNDGRFRTLSLLEGRRAQGFPDSFVLAGNAKEKWEQVGRAVAVPFAEAGARAILEHAQAEKL